MRQRPMAVATDGGGSGRKIVVVTVTTIAVRVVRVAEGVGMARHSVPPSPHMWLERGALGGRRDGGFLRCLSTGGGLEAVGAGSVPAAPDISPRSHFESGVSYAPELAREI